LILIDVNPWFDSGQVVPKALLEMSRSVLRAAFSNVICKR
jgi:hypothetical protein